MHVYDTAADVADARLAVFYMASRTWERRPNPFSRPPPRAVSAGSLTIGQGYGGSTSHPGRDVSEQNAIRVCYGVCYGTAENMTVVASEEITAGQEVTLGGYPGDWLFVEAKEGDSVRLRRSIGEPGAYSAGFWTDVELIRGSRWPA